MGQVFLRPDADQSDGSWLNEASSNTNLFASVDETSASDSDYIQSSTTVGDKVRLRLSDPGTTVASPFIIRYRCKRGSGSAAAGVTGRLFQGTTQKATWQTAVDDTLTTYTYTLTSGELASISDFNDLYVEFEYIAIWWLSAASIDLSFSTSQYYDSSVGDGQAVTSYLSCSRASVGYAQNSDSTLTSFATNTLRIGTGTGLLCEDSRTNDVLWNQDLTNAAWTKTNITAVLNQTGPDGVANSATSITASAANGTVLQSITLGSSARYQSAYIKRITGTGTINMTMDNGSTWTAVIVTGSWTRVEIPTQTLANPTVGFRIVTNGDAVAVDFVQNENGQFATSPIPTTTTSTTRAADQVTYLAGTDTILKSATASFFFHSAPVAAWDAGQVFVIFTETNSPQSNSVSLYSAGNFILADNGVSLGAVPGTSILTNDASGAYGWSPSARSLVANGGTVATDANGVTASVDTFQMGYVARNPDTYIRRMAFWNSKLADATLQALTT